MSGTLAEVPLAARGIDPWAGFKNYYGAAAAQYAPAQAQANVGKTTAETGLIGAQIPETQARTGLFGAQTGLIGQQTIGAGLQNLQQQMMLNLRGQYYGRSMSPTASTSYPDQGGQGGAPVEAPTDFPKRDLNQPPGPAIGAGSATSREPVPPVEPPPEAPGGEQQPSSLTSGWATNGPVRPQIGLYATESEPVQMAPPPGPVQSQPLPPPAIGGAPAGGVPAGGAAPALPPAGAGAGARGTSAGPPPVTTGPNGEMVPGVGAVPWPMAFAMKQAILAGQDPSKVQQQLMADKRQMIGQLVASTIIPGSNPPRHDPQLWNAAVRRAYDDGLIDSAQERQFYGHWDNAQQFESLALTPTEQKSYIQTSGAARTLGEKQGAAPFTQIEIPITKNGVTTKVMGYQGADGKFYALNGELLAPGASATSGGEATGGGGGAAGGQTGGPGATAPAGQAMSAQDYTGRSMAHEGGAGTGPRPNQSGPGGTPTSTAGGGEQFINGTWVSQMRETYPTWAQKYSDAQLLALRSNDDVSKQLTMDYANHNAPILGAAGIPATAANLRLAHSMGPQGAISILKANPNTPLSQILSADAMDANPTYAKQTAGQKVQEIRTQMGDGADLPVRGVAGGLMPSAGAAGGGGGVGYGKPEPGPAVANRIANNNEQLKEDSSDLDKIQGIAQAASTSMPVLYDIKRLTPTAITGSFAEPRTAIANFMATFAPQWAQAFMAATTGLDPRKVGDTQELVKQTFKNVTSAESSLGTGQGGVRVGAMLTQFFQKAMPNINMQGPAIQEMTNWLLVGNQMVKDYAQGAQQHYQASRDTYQADAVSNPYSPLSRYHAQWLDAKSPNAPLVYEAAALAMNHKPFDQWSKGLTRPQMDQVIGVVQRADPANGGALNSRNEWVPVSRFPGAGGG